MNAQHIFKPLVLALAAIVATGAYAEEGDDGGTPANGASATIGDSQRSYGNHVRNEGTENTATVYDAIDGASGNIGVNVTAGDNNQQANAAALSTADAAFVFGAAAVADIDVSQKGKNNTLNNYSVPNVANLHDAVNNTTGNVGINISAGNYNQQKNDMAAAVSETAYIASANSDVSQKLSGNTTNNYATLDYGTVAVTLGMTASGNYSGAGSGSYNGTAAGTTAGTADQIGDVYPDLWDGSHFPGGSVQTGHMDLDSAAQGAQDPNNDGGALLFGEEGTYSGSQSGSLGFQEAGSTSLAGTVSGSIPVVAGFNTPVVNDARMYNALNDISGNVGVNIAAGGGNQQSNSLAIAAGCTACAGGAVGGGDSGSNGF
jgi:hypothetical protein